MFRVNRNVKLLVSWNHPYTFVLVLWTALSWTCVMSSGTDLSHKGQRSNIANTWHAMTNLYSSLHPCFYSNRWVLFSMYWQEVVDCFIYHNVVKSDVSCKLPCLQCKLASWGAVTLLAEYILHVSLWFMVYNNHPSVLGLHCQSWVVIDHKSRATMHDQNVISCITIYRWALYSSNSPSLYSPKLPV